jgi:hypothetical protein
MIWHLLHPKATPDMLGFVPDFFSDDCPLSAKEQVNLNYQHGGGWRSFSGFTMTPEGIYFPGDPVMPPIASTILHAGTDKQEVIVLYMASWLAVIQLDGSYDIARVD